MKAIIDIERLGRTGEGRINSTTRNEERKRRRRRTVAQRVRAAGTRWNTINTTTGLQADGQERCGLDSLARTGSTQS